MTRLKYNAGTNVTYSLVRDARNDCIYLERMERGMKLERTYIPEQLLMMFVDLHLNEKLKAKLNKIFELGE